MRWSEAHKAIVHQHWQDMTDGEMGDLVGRTAPAVASFRKLAGLHRNPVAKRDVEGFILRNWDKKSASDIGCAIGYGATYVRQFAARLGLPPKPMANCVSNAPAKPRGLGRATIKWAEANLSDPEARMILAMSGRDMRT
jgi:hypothetical protein